MPYTIAVKFSPKAAWTKVSTANTVSAAVRELDRLEATGTYYGVHIEFEGYVLP